MPKVKPPAEISTWALDFPCLHSQIFQREPFFRLPGSWWWALHESPCSMGSGWQGGFYTKKYCHVMGPTRQPGYFHCSWTLRHGLGLLIHSWNDKPANGIMDISVPSSWQQGALTSVLAYLLHVWWRKQVGTSKHHLSALSLPIPSPLSIHMIWATCASLLQEQGSDLCHSCCLMLEVRPRLPGNNDNLCNVPLSLCDSVIQSVRRKNSIIPFF